MNAMSVSPTLGTFDLRALYGDGMNLYGYLGSNPVTRRDPMGLCSNPFDCAIDEAIGEYIGERAAYAAALGDKVATGLNTAKLLGGLAVSLLPAGDVLILGVTFFSGGEVTAWDVAGAGLSIVGGAIIGKVVGKFFKARRAYKAGKAGHGLTPGGRALSRHYARDRGTRNLPMSVLDDTIDNYPGVSGRGGTTVHYSPSNDVTVILGSDGNTIVTARRGPP